MKDSYNSWVDRVAGGREGKPLVAGETVATSADNPKPFAGVVFVSLERPLYRAEVGRKGDDYIYHFYPKKQDDKFEDKMGDAMLSSFKYVDRLESVYTEEMNSFAVRARGFASNPFGDELAAKVFDKLDSLLE